MNLESYCRRLVEFKYALDDEIGKRSNHSKSYVHAVPPHEFADKVIPFWTIKNCTASYLSLIDPDYVVGATYKRFSENSAEKCRIINANDSDTAEYEKIGDLPLYIALEGKNRVRLFQAQQLKIKARMTQIAFPAPEELLLHQVRQTKNYYLYCSNDFYVQQDEPQVLLLYPEIMVPLFKSYGVKEGKRIKNIFPINRKLIKSQQKLEALSLC